jgi:hypothetical protein
MNCSLIKYGSDDKGKSLIAYAAVFAFFRLDKSLQFSLKMHRVQSLFLVLLIICRLHDILAIVGGRHAKTPPYDDPVVFINHIGRFSRVEGYFNPTTQLYTFRGIRYADPPVRENRFLRPKLKRLVGNVDARKNAPPCPQPDFYGKQLKHCLIARLFK